MNQTNRRTVKPDMTEPTDIDDLVSWARSLGDPDFTLSVPGHAKAAFRKLADALESLAEGRDSST